MSYTTQVVDTTTGAPVTDRLLSPYQCAGLVNRELADRGIDRTLPPQMFYNYVKQGMLPHVLVDGKKKVSELALAKWLENYLTRMDARAAKKAQAAQA